MITRILEALDSYNQRQDREKAGRERSRRDEDEMRRRRAAAGKPTGIACPACHAEMGIGTTCIAGGKSDTAPRWQEFESHREVVCPQCGYRGWKVEYSSDGRFDEPAPINAVDPSATNTGTRSTRV